MPGRRRRTVTTGQPHSIAKVSIGFTEPPRPLELRNNSHSNTDVNLPTLPLNTAIFNLNLMVLKYGGFPAFIAYAFSKIYPQAFATNFRYANEITDTPRVILFDVQATGDAVRVISNDVNERRIKNKIAAVMDNGNIVGEMLRYLQGTVIESVLIGNWQTGEERSREVSVVEQVQRRQSLNQPIINTGDNYKNINTTYVHNSYSSQNEASSDCIDKFHQAMKNHLQTLTCQHKMSNRKLVATNPVGIKVSPNPVSVKSQLSNDDQRIVMQNSFPIQLEDIFSKAAEKVEELCIGFSDGDRELYRKIHSRNILLTGQAGMGKSTATYSIARKVQNGEIAALEGVNHIGYFQMRDINFEEEVNLIDFIITYGTDISSVTFTPADKEMIKKHVLANADEYLFIFDGLDEANMEDLEAEAKSCGIEKKCRPSNVIKLIMKGSYLKGSFKLWTSRSQHAYSIDPDHRPFCIMQLLGLDDEAQIELGRQASSENWSGVNRVLVDHPNLKAMCYVPVWCIIICVVLRKQILEQGRTSISTITELLLAALKYFMSCVKTGSTESRDLLTVADLAWKGLKDKRLIFENQHFVDANVTKSLQQSLLHTNLQEVNTMPFRIMVSEQRSYFVHLIWQELFGSIHLAAMSMNEFESSISVISNRQFDVVSRLLFGLFNKNNRDLNLFSGMRLDEEKLDLMIENAVGLLWHDGEGKTHLLHVCCLAQELNHSPFTERIAEIFPDVIDFSTTNPDNSLILFPSDVMNLHYVLNVRKGELSKIDMHSVQFMGNSLELIGNTFQLIEKIETLDLSYVNLGEEIKFIALSVLKISCLDLVDCNITHDGVSHLTRVLKSSPNFRMKRLDLSGNDIGDIGIKKLGAVVKNFSELAVQQCGFGMPGWQSLADKIKVLHLPIETLRIDGNDLGDQGINTLKQCWRKIKIIHVLNCGFSDFQRNSLAQLARNMPSCYSNSDFTCEVYS